MYAMFYSYYDKNKFNFYDAFERQLLQPRNLFALH